MRALEVSPAALPSAARALDGFAAALEAVPQPALPGELGAALAAFVDSWEVWLLAEDARVAAAAVDDAAELYQRLERLLVPAALR